jgi:Cu/Ag efflux protein CusF
MKRYAFTGRVISIDNQSQSAIIDGDTIPGFMVAMTMSYKIQSAAELSRLNPGDSISADVVVVEPDAKNSDASPDYWLENVKITASGKRSTP